MILRKNSKPEEIFFILKGRVLNRISKTIFTEGNMIGETDIYYNKRERVEEYITLSKVYIIAVDYYEFNQICD